MNLAFLVKILHSRVNNAAQGELPDPAHLKLFNEFTNAAEVILDPRRGSYNPDACVRLIGVEDYGSELSSRQVPQSASDRIMQILEPWLSGNDSFSTWGQWMEKARECRDRVIEEIDNHYKDWEIISKSRAEFLADEECGFRRADAQEFARMMGKPELVVEKDHDDDDPSGQSSSR